MLLHLFEGREQVGLVAHVIRESRRGRIRVRAVADRLEESVEPEGHGIAVGGRARAGQRIDDGFAAGETNDGCQRKQEGESALFSHR